MLHICSKSALSLIIGSVILLAGCSGPAAAPGTPPQPSRAPADSLPVVQAPSQPQQVQPAAPVLQNSDNRTGPAPQSAALRESRIEVIYSHMNQRCPTCLCFEERINAVIEAYFGDAIAEGRLSYRVLNAQEAKNESFARKYKAVGSQLFINTVINGYDNIDDILDIWNWDCRANKANFDQKVKGEIEARLKNMG